MEDNMDAGATPKGSLSREHVELLIDKKIAETKTVITEKRLAFTLALSAGLVTLFGIMLPLFFSLESSRRTDAAIQRMEHDFETLANRQLRSPEIAVTINGMNLEHNTLRFAPDVTRQTILVTNIGAAATGNLKIRLFLTQPEEDFRLIFPSFPWEEDTFSFNDKPDFPIMRVYAYKDFSLPAKDTLSIWFDAHNRHLQKTAFHENAILSIFYGEPTPKEIPFNIEIQKPPGTP